MLVASSEAALGSASVRWTLLFERAIRGTLAYRRGLAYDTRYAAPASGEPEPVGHLVQLLAGTLHADDGTQHEAPIALLVSDEEIERPRRTSHWFRTDGARVELVQLRIAGEYLRAPIGLTHGAVRLSARTWDATAGLLARGPSADSAALVGLLAALARDGVVASSVTDTVVASEPARFRRLWDALTPLYQAHGPAVSLKQLANRLGMSMRQVGRDAKEMASVFGIAGGYRDSLLLLRLRTAVLLLAADGAAVGDVARLVGYGSPIAMARAFRDAGLPAPNAIQAELATAR